MTADPAASDRAPRLSRPQLEALQTLFIRLLFSGETLKAFQDAPDGVLDRYGLPASARRLLPDPHSKNFLAESRGRRIGVVREIDARYERTAAFFKDRARQAGPGPAPLQYDEFLASDYFLDPDHALPHPYGVGPGYENVSKFFFWLRDRYGLNRPGADIGLRASVYSDFALYLVTLRMRPCHPYYDRFKGGVCWTQVAGQDVPAMLLTEDQVLVTLKDPAKAGEIRRVGIVDLDTLVPEPPEREPAI